MIARLRHEERGVALLLALGFSVALSLLVFGMTEYVTSNQRNARNSNNDTLARSYAEAALNTAYSRINYANTQSAISSGLSPSKPSLLGCGTGTNGASDCSAISPMCVSFTASCPSSGNYTPTAGTASVYGFYTGTSPTAGAKFAGIDQVASEWVISATGYSRNSSGGLDAKTMRATVMIRAASAWAFA